MLVLSAILIVFALIAAPYWRIILSIFAGLLLGLMRAGVVVREQRIASSYIGHDLILSATVTDKPEYKNHQTHVKISDIYFNYSTDSIKCQAYAVLAGEWRDINRSDIITVRGSPKSGFGAYTFSIYRPQLISISKPSPPDFALQARNYFVQNVQQSFGDTDLASLALGFLMGEKTLSNKIKEQLRIVGLSHVVVASGFCLSVLVEFVKKTIGKASRFASFFFSVVLIVIFVSITGFSPSLIRASIVSVLSLFARYFGHNYHPGRLLVYVAALSTLIKPTAVLELAWQLSFLSFTGIILIVPILQRFFYGQETPSWLASMIFATISAQFACLPLSIYTFGQLSIVGVISNLLITPLIPVIMALTFVVGVCPFKIPLLVSINRLFLLYQIEVINRLSAAKWAIVDIPANHPIIFIVYIPIIIVILVIKHRLSYSYRPSFTLDKSPKYGKIYTC